MRIKTRYQGYCTNCKYTIWRNEQANINNANLTHLDCKSALMDRSPRVINPKFVKILGNVNKKKLRQALSKQVLGDASLPSTP